MKFYVFDSSILRSRLSDNSTDCTRVQRVYPSSDVYLVRKSLSFDVFFLLFSSCIFVFQMCCVRLVHQYRSSTNGVS